MIISMTEKALDKNTILLHDKISQKILQSNQDNMGLA